MALDPRLRSPKERPLFVLAVIFSGITWLLLVVSIVGLLYGALIAAFIAVAHALFLAHVHGNGVRVSAKQHPDLHARVRGASARLGLPRTPEVYVMQGGGLLNAFATKLFSRRFVILLSDLVDQCADPRQLDFVVGHELAHHAAGHLAWNAFLAPAQVVPLLGPAHSRAKEYTCDRAGAAVAADTEQAMRGLVVLASGGKLAAATNLEAFMEQAAETGGVWSAVAELSSSHPFLCKRVLALKEWVAPGTALPPGRNPVAYLLAPFLGLASGPAAGGGALAMVAVLSILAAIAIPNFVRYQERAREAAALQQLRELQAAQEAVAPEQPVEPAAAPLAPGDAPELPAEVRRQLEELRARYEAERQRQK